MSTDPTARSGSFAGLGPVIEALVYLQATYPHLPAPYIPIDSTGATLGINAPGPAAFEEWRVALQIPAHLIELYGHGDRAWLAADTTVRGVHVHLSGHGVLLTGVQPHPESPAFPGTTEAVEPAGGAR
ncbi:hypothetical protein ACRAR1_06910 [Streptomyces sanyensis]|uniref:hypothetical protein n=1 Tax=Streptomyces sanyensis TaxID=568869 RepID=UPI003D76C755